MATGVGVAVVGVGAAVAGGAAVGAGATAVAERLVTPTTPTTPKEDIWRDVVDAIEKEDWATLRSRDQLLDAMDTGVAFDGFREAQLAFPPTYKLIRNDEDALRYKQNRRPAWCDRVIWRGDAVACSHGDPEMRRDVRALEALIEERQMQLAYADRPDIEQRFSKIELKTYKRLFNEFSVRGPPRGVEIKRIRELMKKCCTVFRDYKTRRHMTKKNCNRVVSIYDADFSGKIEWGEFLHAMVDLKQGTLMDRLSSMFSW